MLLLGYAEQMRAVFPAFTVPGFTPDFIGYDLDQRGIDWYNLYLTTAPNDSLSTYVRTASSCT